MRGTPYALLSTAICFAMLLFLDAWLGFRFTFCFGLAAVYGEAACARVNTQGRRESKPKTEPIEMAPMSLFSRTKETK
jgi:hypothetical protein